MARDDSILYSGTNSGAARRLKEQREARKKEKEVKQGLLLPVGDLVIQEIDKELAEVEKLAMGIIHSNMTAKEVQITVESIRQTYERLMSLKMRFNNILRVHEEVNNEE